MQSNTFNQQQVRDFERLDFLARQIVEGFITGLHKSPYHGFSVEFAEHRLYNKGESTRHIDWKLFARTDKLFVKRYEEETNLRCQLVIDTSGSMHYPSDKSNQIDDLNKLGFSVYAAAAIINLLRRQRDASGLTLFNSEIDFHLKASNTMKHQMRLYAELSKALQGANEVKNTKTTDLIQTLHLVSERLHKRSLVVLFTDMINSDAQHEDEVFSALQHLKYNKHEVLLFHVTDAKHEMQFDFENRPHQFVDMETGQKMKLNPAELQKAYREQAKKRFEELKLRCSQYQIDLIEADINSGFDAILLAYLLKRQKMY